jgi:hypothetical protein
MIMEIAWKNDEEIVNALYIFGNIFTKIENP